MAKKAALTTEASTSPLALIAAMSDVDKKALLSALGMSPATLAAVEAPKSAPPAPIDNTPMTVKTEMRIGKDGSISLIVPSITGRTFASFPVSSTGKTHKVSNGRYIPPGFGAMKGEDGVTYHVVFSWNLYAQPGAASEG